MGTRNIEDAYGLSPLQEGMLFHALDAPEEGLYVMQHGVTLAGALDVPAFEFAWRQVVARHAVLRTAFAWKTTGKPLQVVGREVGLPLTVEDWSELPAEERERRWADLLTADRKRGFEPARAPLMRLTLIREAPDVHRLLWTRHHMLMDGWSAEKVMGEIFAIYEARRHGRDLALSPPRPFREYIAWLSRQDLASAETFWRRELAGFAAPTPLMEGTRGSANGHQIGRQHRQTLALPGALADEVRSFARSNQLTLNTLLQGVWAALLGRYSGQDDVVFGVTVSGRPPDLPGSESMVGLFINTLPFRVDVRARQPLLLWLRGLQERQVEMRQYEYSPLPQVQGWSDVPRALPLFESYMVFENYPEDRELRRGGTGLEVRDSQWIGQVNYPLIFEGSSSLHLNAYYDSRRFDAATLLRLLGHVETLVEGFVRHPEGYLEEMPLLTEAERIQLAVEWQGAEASRPAACLHSLIEAQAAWTPEAEAVSFDGEPLAYRDLDLRASRLASLLAGLGAGPEVPVGVCLEPSHELVIALLAVLKSGAAYLPLDPALPQERLAWMLTDSEASIAVTGRQQAALLSEVRAELVLADAGNQEGTGGTAGKTDSGVAPENAAYVIYTSGSTGRPKGVVNSHRAILNRLLWMQEAFPLGAGDAVLQKTPFGFDASIWELFLPLLAGAKLVVARPGGYRDPSYLAQTIAEHGVTVLQLVPSLLRPFLETEGISGCGSVRRLFCGGEALGAELRDLCFSTLDAELCNLYGPTECSIDATFWVCRPEDRRRPVPIGRPIANVATRLLDRQLRQVPIGVIGELHVTGAGLARGYLGRPELTAERFIPDPFGGTVGARQYRTGDLARLRPDGAIEYLGRIDHQVKVRGVRIELGEIEAMLVRHPSVAEAVVLVREAPSGDRQLVAYVVLEGGASHLESGLLREFLGERLLEAMVPAAFVVLEALPRTAGGKVDRGALSQVEPVLEGRQLELPRNQVEELLAGIWAEILGLDQVGIKDDFFEMGGHSLLVVQVTSRVKAVFGVRVRMRALFENRTVEALAGLVQGAMSVGDTMPAPPLAKGPRDHSMPLSFAQQRLWFIDQLEPGSPLYNLPAAVRLRGDFDVRALGGALSEIVVRHEVLRTSYPSVAGQPVQAIAPPQPFPMPLVDLSGLDGEAAEGQVRRLAAQDAARPFDLARGPVLRVTLLRLEGREHVALINLHHIAGDAWSMEIFLRELVALYRALSKGRPSPLPELPIQYADFASWQRSWLSDEVLEEQLRYWRERLAGAPAVLELPADRIRTGGRRRRGARHSVRTPAALAQRVAELGRREGVTVFMVLLTALQGLLGRYSGQEDVVVGTPVAGRNQLETENLIGFFINALVLRSGLSGDPTLRELLGRVREVTLSAYSHQEIPFERLVEELQPDRTLAHSPLFQVIFGHQRVAPPAALDLPGLTLEAVGVERGQFSKFDLGLELDAVGEDLAGYWEYDPDLFDATTIGRLTGHLETLLAAMSDQPESRLWDLPLLSEAQHQQLLAEWNDTAGRGTAGALLHELFAAQAALTPDGVAVLAGEERFTYRQLDEQSNQLARHLQRQGVGRDVRVALCVDRSFSMVLGILGVFKAGGAYVPLDPSYPAERLALILEDALGDAAPSVLLTQERFAGLFPQEDGRRVVRLDTDWEAIAAEAPAPLAGEALPESLAYVIYTSGSTGRPKGVALAHHGLANLCAAQAGLFGLGAEDRVLQFSSLSFDLSLWELAMALTRGATLCLASRQELLPGPELADRLRRLGITAATLPPAALAALPDESLPDLRTLIVGGEAWHVDLARRWQRGRRLFNGYGPTEVTVCASAALFQDGSEVLLLGRPIEGTRFHVLDQRMIPVPVGAAGELYIAGPGLARGYLNRSDLTAAVFLPDPFSQEPGVRLYRTGDRVRLRPDGQAEFLGRLGDHQVKIRGFRIELGEIEAVLRRHPAVREVVTLVREVLPGDKRLVACVVPREPGVQPGDLRSFLKARLPEHLVPSAFLLLSELPLLPSGKVDRRALEGVEVAYEEAGGEGYGALRTPVEELLAGIFAEVLHRNQVGVEDSFFDLGGHSLLATQLISRLRATFGVELPLRALFERPTVTALAVSIEGLLREQKGGAEVPPLRPVRRDLDLPLSFAQERLWFLNQLDPESPTYNMPLVLGLRGRLVWQALSFSLEALIARHEALRTTFAVQENRPLQRIAPSLSVGLPIVDVSGLPAGLIDLEVKRLAREEAVRPFDLLHGPLVRAALLRLGLVGSVGEEERHVALFTLHHIVSDGWSMGVLVRELGALYGALVDGGDAERAALPELTVQYADFAVWQRTWLSGEVLEEQLAYWREHLAQAPTVLDLPLDRPRPRVQSFRGVRVPVLLPLALGQGLTALGRAQGATLFMVLLAAFQALLARMSGQEDLVVGSPVANRNRAETEGVIGFFINTLALRGRLTGDPSFAELVVRAREAALGGYIHQDLPFEKLVEELQPERSLAHSPLFQVVLALQNAPMGDLELPGLTLEPVAVEQELAKFDITLSLTEASLGLVGILEYSRDLFDTTTATRMAQRFERLLAGAVERPAARIAELPLLAEPEWHQVVIDWNERGTKTSRWYCVHELFEAQARRAPEAVAVTFGDRWLTYGELDSRSNQLAHRLRKLGVRPEVRVGVCMERSLEVVVALLGILKSGGAYLPLDPTYPRERLAFMIADGQLSVLVTEPELLDVLPQQDRPVLCVTAGWREVASESTESLRHDVTGENLAYVMYTSGSTGTPKGVSIPHRALSWFVSTLSYVDPQPSDRFAQGSTHSFDAATFEIWGALSHGARVVGIPKEAMIAPEELAARLQEQGITVLYLTAALFKQTVSQAPAAFRSLRRLLVGGEVVDASFFRRSLDSGAPEVLLYLYGPTETTVFSTWEEVGAGPELAAVLSIGRPIAEAPHFLLDLELRPVPVGIVGEMYIGGGGLARDYLNRPDLTAERFIPRPFGDEPGARLYRTGDLARYLADGRMEFSGRVDDQVKIRGFRIEPQEIESVLVQHPAVLKAVVLPRHDGVGGKRLAAYLVARTGQAPSATELRALLREKLPEYMVPAAFVLLSALPLTAQGKVDRRALPDPSGSPEPSGAEEAPYTPIQEVLATLWSAVLRVELPSVHASFFDLGGHSLLATQLASRIRQAFGVELPLRTIFEQPTIASLAFSLEALLRQERGHEALPLFPSPRIGPLPLSLTQERLWFLDQLDPGSAMYNIPLAVELQGRLVPWALTAGLSAIVARHEALRTTFVSSAGQPAQVIAPATPLALPVVDLEALPAEPRDAEARALAGEEAGRPFDLGRGPLVRATLLRMSEEKHIALTTMHHIVSDGWSVKILFAELGELYDAYSQGLEPSLPVLPVQYADFAVWQRSWMEGEGLAEQLAYWRKRLHGAPPVLELPADRARPLVQSGRGATLESRLSPRLTAALSAFSRREGVTFFMALLAGFYALLYRYTGQGDLVVGTDVANRNRAEVEGLIGFFVNQLVLRTDAADDPAFRTLLERVRQICLEAYAHQDLPFSRLVQELKPERDLSRQPLFQVTFTFHNRAAASRELPGLALRSMPLPSNTAKFDLALALHELADGWLLGAEYSTDLFDATTVDRLLAHFERLLEGSVAHPEERLSGFEILLEAEREQLLVEIGRCGVELPQRPFAHQAFTETVVEQPLAVAAVCAREEVTYGELNERANRIAAWLQERGVVCEERVGLCGERGIGMLAAVLGILKAGACFVPLDPAHPTPRLRSILETSGLRFIATEARWEARVRELAELISPSPGVLCWDRAAGADEDPDLPASWAGSSLAVPIEPHQLACIFYTSGSTGTPKGAMVEHVGMLNHLLAKIDLLKLDKRSVVVQNASHCFDISVWQFLAALMVGGRVVIYGDETALDPPRLLRALRRDRATVLETVPTLLEPMLQAVSELADRGEGFGLPDLTYLISNAETLPVPLSRRWFESFPRVPLINTYGATECSDDTTHHMMQAAPSSTALRVEVGRPIPSFRIYILDSQLNLLPMGCPGEIGMAGVGVGRGYLNDPERTAAVFVPEPFASEPGSRLYRTGDLGRWTPEGVLDFVGRKDHQVKVRGHRVELGEIEAVLARHPAVRETVVLARRDQTSNVRLAAYVVPHESERAAEAKAALKMSDSLADGLVPQLRTFLGERLPDWMVPAAFVLLPDLPLTPNGKVDRAALPQPDPVRPDLGNYTPPQGVIEEGLAAIWAQVLGLDQIGAHDNFFELGGDSILAIQIVARAHKQGLGLTPRDLFQNQTVAELAAVVDASKMIDVEQGLVIGPVPLTPIQRWFFEQGFSDPHHFNQTVFLRMREAFDPAAMEEAVRRVLLHHDALRLRFVREEEDWGQIIAVPDAAVPFSRLDLSTLPTDRRSAAIESAAALAQGGCDLMAGPLLRFVFFDLGAQSSGRLLIVVHHLVIDGVSWRILLEDLETAYRQRSRGEEVELPRKTSSFKRWAERLSEHTAGGGFDQEWDYWLAAERAYLPPLPVDFPGGANTISSARSLSLSLDVEATAALLLDVPKAFRVQIEEVLLAALARAVMRWTGGNSLGIVLEGHGREALFDDLDLSRTVGWFTSEAPVLIDLTAAATPLDALKVVKEQLRSMPSGGVGYGAVRYLSSSNPELAERLRRVPPGGVIFNYLGRLDRGLPDASAFQPAAESSGPTRSPQALRSHVLEFGSHVAEGRLELTCTYSENLHRRSAIESLTAGCMEELRTLIAHCQSAETIGYTPSDFPQIRLDQSELDDLLSGFTAALEDS